jgi:pimeloyl-ACP methyl ester carboxylesterase
MTENVVLLHGLWLRASAMGFLARHLRADGFEPHLFGYSSVHDGIDAAGANLRECVRGLEGPVHLVGHSLGGVLAATLVQRSPELIDGRIVCLGAPLRGSAASRSLQRLPGGATLLGRSSEFLERGLESWTAPRQLGAIAGRLPIGLGFLLGGVPMPHDGSVGVDETRLPGITDHWVISAAHTGLVFSELAARQVGAFLREGRFE